MTTLGQRKVAMYLASLASREQKLLLARLPGESARTLRKIIRELQRMGWASPDLAEAVLSEDIRGLTARTSLGVEQLLALSKSLSPAWFARVLMASGPIDREFMLALLDENYAGSVRMQMSGMPALPARVQEALLSQSLALATVS